MKPSATRRRYHPRFPLALFAILMTSCATRPEPLVDNQPPPTIDPVTPVAPVTPTSAAATPENDQAPIETVSDEQSNALEGTKPIATQPPTDAQKRIDALLTTYFASHSTRRMYLMVDKPLYQPGETVWFKAGAFATSSLIGGARGGVSFQLISPRGSIAMTRRVAEDAHGVAANDFPLPADIAGGEYTIKASADDGTTDERKVIVASYEAPRLKKALEFMRKAYGPGDVVSAAVSVARPTGEPFAQKTLTAIATVDDAEVARLPVTTDGAGMVVVRFPLPQSIARGDALLTVMAEEGGVTESIQKRIPVVLKSVKLTLFPEGGDLVVGLPSRIYFSAQNTLGKPADVQGRLVDEQGSTLAKFASLHDGMGRFAITPKPGQRYHVEITRPVGIAEKFALPKAQPIGCTLHAVDDFSSQRDELRVAAFCTEARAVVVEALLREARVASATADVRRGAPTVVALAVPRTSQGAVRVTLLDQQLQPLAERLVFRGRGADLKVKVSAAKSKLGPRDQVALTVETTDLAGHPVEADVGVAVVDDTVLSFADDKSANLIAHLYLDKELGDAAQSSATAIEEPNFYFSAKPEAPASLDLVMGTRGWRRFEWQQVLAPPPSSHAWSRNAPTGDAVAENAAIAAAAPQPDAARRHGQARAPVAAKPMAPPQIIAGVKDLPAAADDEKRVMAMGKAERAHVADRERGRRMGPAMNRPEMVEEQAWQWAAVRRFPIPDYSHVEANTPRTDFRETVFWNPSVTTDKSGRAEVKFYLSDAVTSFRATVEGGSQGGLIGRGEAVVQSKLPLSLDAKLPVEVSSGDTLRLPVTLTNETERDLDATLTAKFGDAFKLEENPAAAPIHLAAGERRALFFPLTVVGAEGESDVAFTTDTAGLHDELKRKVHVVALGFPEHASFAGTVQNRVEHTIDLETALPKTLVATVTMYPSPLSTLVKGADGILREPGGCFEQTSSSNYPNAMAAQYLLAHDVADPALVEKIHGLLDRGYKRLTGYESPKHGYEWFGGDPGHEALTAYGIMEFSDMSKIYENVDRSMIDRTVKWIDSRRDGKGGYLRNARALDSFGGAPPEVTDAYITWALTESGKRDLTVEVAAQRRLGAETSDPYLAALVANTLENVKDAAASSTVNRLAALQAKDGSFPGAKTSITRSGGQALAIETTSLAVLALMREPGHDAEARAAVEWLTKNDNGYGAYGSTQSTVLALKALNTYAEHTRRAASDGTATVFVNGQQVGRITFEKGRKDPLVFDDLAASMVRGKNRVEIRLASASALPYAVSIDWRTAEPSSSPGAQVRMTTTLAKERVRMGESVRLVAHVESVAKEGLPMTLARVGLPGGLTFQTWQLKELRERGVIDFYETRPREVILYFRALAPEAKKDIALDLLATTPGSYTGPASSSYLYYTNELKHWAEPLRVTIAP